MPFELELRDDTYIPWHLRRLRQHCRHAQDSLDSARAVYASLRKAGNASALQLQQAQQRIDRAAQHLADIQFTLELLEGSQCGVRVWQ